MRKILFFIPVFILSITLAIVLSSFLVWDFFVFLCSLNLAFRLALGFGVVLLVVAFLCVKNNKFKMILFFLVMYIFITIVSVGLYFKFNKGQDSFDANVISIMTWVTYLLAPLVAIWVFSDWREQYNKVVDKEVIFGIISKLNDFQYETIVFYKAINVFFAEVENNDYVLEINVQKFIKYMRELIKKYEDSKLIVSNVYSDLAAIMGDKKYEEFSNQFKCITDAVDLHTNRVDNLLNKVIHEKIQPKNLKKIFDQEKIIYEYIVLSNGGIVDRIKATKKELTAFYKVPVN